MKSITIFVIVLILVLAAIVVARGQQYIDVKDQFLKEINTLRKKAGRKPVVYNEKYQQGCDSWALVLTKHLIHSASHYYGEVVSHVPASEELVIEAFMRSPGHKAVLMDKKAKSICLSVYTIPRHHIVRPNEVEYVPDMFYTVIRTY